MIEAAMIWNEPNNKSHWDPEIDPEWTMFADMAIQAADAIRRANPQVKRVLGGMSPIDPHWAQRMKNYGVIDAVDVVALHGFPLDWNLWPINEWPQRIADILPGRELIVVDAAVEGHGVPVAFVHVVAGGDVVVLLPQGDGVAGVRFEDHDGAPRHLGHQHEHLAADLRRHNHRRSGTNAMHVRNGC